MILVVGGDSLVYEESTWSPVESMLETKLLLNSIISYDQQGAIFMSCDLKYLPEYTKTHIQFSARYDWKIQFDEQSFR